MSSGPRRKEAPTEPLKRAIGFCVRAIAGHPDLDVGFAAGAPEYSTGHVQLPEPSRVPSPREIAVIRGWADSFALTAGCHDVRVHNKLAPTAGPARLVFEAAERARVEALGANRMPGMARNLTARIEDQYAHGRYAQVKTRADAPLEDAVALMIRERLTGLPPPASAKALVDVWRDSIEKRGAKKSSCRSIARSARKGKRRQMLCGNRTKRSTMSSPPAARSGIRRQVRLRRGQSRFESAPQNRQVWR